MKLKYEIKILRRYRQPKAQAGAAKVWALGGGATVAIRGGGGSATLYLTQSVVFTNTYVKYFAVSAAVTSRLSVNYGLIWYYVIRVCCRTPYRPTWRPTCGRPTSAAGPANRRPRYTGSTKMINIKLIVTKACSWVARWDTGKG